MKSAIRTARRKRCAVLPRHHAPHRPAHVCNNSAGPQLDVTRSGNADSYYEGFTNMGTTLDDIYKNIDSPYNNVRENAHDSSTTVGRYLSWEMQDKLWDKQNRDVFMRGR